MTLSRQLFFRFYLLIVLALVVVGVGFESFWSLTTGDSDEFHSLESELVTISELLSSIREPERQTALERLNRKYNNNFSIISSKQIKAFGISSEFKDNRVVTLENDDGTLSAYYLFLDGDAYLVKSIEPSKALSPIFKWGFLTTFYIIIALIVYLTTRPLARDLKQLENAAKSFANDKWETPIRVSQSSPVYRLADTYNRLIARVHQLLKDQKEMSHAISHELRTPLARIKFSLEMALNSQDNSVKNSHLNSITEDIVEIQDLIEELLNFAALEASATKAKMERGDIVSLINTQIEKHARMSESVKIKLNTDEQILFVHCDSSLIERALQNLITNGLKYASKKVEISLSCSKRHVTIFVDDDGEGVAEDKRQNIFNSFVRLNNTEKSKGFGLGLAIVKRIASLHEGKVSVEESELGGARFVLSWPHRSEVRFN